MPQQPLGHASSHTRHTLPPHKHPHPPARNPMSNTHTRPPSRIPYRTPPTRPCRRRAAATSLGEAPPSSATLTTSSAPPRPSSECVEHCRACVVLHTYRRDVLFDGVNLRVGLFGMFRGPVSVCVSRFVACGPRAVSHDGAYLRALCTHVYVYVARSTHAGYTSSYWSCGRSPGRACVCPPRRLWSWPWWSSTRSSPPPSHSACVCLDPSVVGMRVVQRGVCQEACGTRGGCDSAPLMRSQVPSRRGQGPGDRAARQM
jgi:hypothetical protein